MGKYDLETFFEDRVCRHSKCGNTFSVDKYHLSQNYCSSKCRQKANYKYKPVELRTERVPVEYNCNCFQCGIEFISGRKNGMYCSYNCRYKHYTPPPVKLKKGLCLNCNNEYQYTAKNQKFCSIKCSVINRNKHLTLISGDIVTHRRCSLCFQYKEISLFMRGRVQCLECENERRRKNRDPIKDRAKGKKWRSEKGWIGKSCKIYINTCQKSGKIFVSKSKYQKVSPNWEFLNKMERTIKKHRIDVDRYERSQKFLYCACVECNKLIKYNKFIVPKYILERKEAPKYCSKLCANKVQKRKQRAVRRSLERKATKEYVDPFIVFKKHNWKCQNCGCDTPKALRGTYSDNAPELDHIIPISKGGFHEYSNVQLLCRLCNGNKSNKILNLCHDQNTSLRLT